MRIVRGFFGLLGKLQEKYVDALGHYMKSYMKYILSKLAIIALMPEIIFVSD